MKATDQDWNRNPTGKGGFGDNPQNRNPGGWKKEDTPRYKLEQMMKLQELDLQEIAEDVEAPLFERKLAEAIRKGKWREIEAMINQVYGQPKQTIDNQVTIPEPLAPVRQQELDEINNSVQ